MTYACGAHLVGSLAVPTAADAFGQTAATLGRHLRRASDGETRSKRSPRDTMGSSCRPVEAGRLRVIATTGPEREPVLRAVRRSGRQATGGGAGFLANSCAA